MSGGLGNFGLHIRMAAHTLVEQASYGLAAGSAAGYLATALKVSKALTFVNLGIAFAAGWGSLLLLKYLINRIDNFNEFYLANQNSVAMKIAHNVALPALAALGAIFSVRYASLTVYTIAAVFAGAYVLGTWLVPKVAVRPQPQRQPQVVLE